MRANKPWPLFLPETGILSFFSFFFVCVFCYFFFIGYTILTIGSVRFGRKQKRQRESRYSSDYMKRKWVTGRQYECLSIRAACVSVSVYTTQISGTFIATHLHHRRITPVHRHCSLLFQRCDRIHISCLFYIAEYSKGTA